MFLSAWLIVHSTLASDYASRGHSWKKDEEPKDKNLHFIYTRLIMDWLIAGHSHLSLYEH